MVGVGVGLRHGAQTVVLVALRVVPAATDVRGAAGWMSVRAVGAVITDIGTT